MTIDPRVANGFLARAFDLPGRGTTVRAELLAGILMGLVANVPLALAPGMGRNTYFSFTVVRQMHVPWPVALRCVFVSGLCFLFVFLFVDLFDNLGTLVTVTKRAGLIGADGRIPHRNRMLLTDASATMVGALAGTSTVTSYVESAAGVQAGGRTGLTAIVTGLPFLLTMVAAPYAALVPVAATAPASILVGAPMMAPLAEIDWSDAGVALPAFLTVALIPLTFSIANGLAFGITAHAG